MKDGVTVAAMVLIGSFAIDRLVTVLLFLLSFLPAWGKYFPDALLVSDPIARTAAEKRRKLMYFGFASLIAIVLILAYPKLLVLSSLGITAGPWADRFFTLLVLVGGSDQIAGLLGSPGAAGAEKPHEAPIQITGTLTLEEGGSGKAVNPKNP